MPKKTKYSDEPLGKFRIVDDFLPAPEDLVFREEVVKVTLSLSKKSLEFFKDQAERQHVPYQKMIRALVDHYADHHTT